MADPFAPEVFEIDNIQKKKADDENGVVGGTVPVDIVQLNPHSEFIEGDTESKAVNKREFEAGLV